MVLVIIAAAVAAYIAVWIFYGRFLLTNFVDQVIREEMERYPALFKTPADVRRRNDFERDKGMAYLLAAAWPVVMSIRACVGFVDRFTDGVITPVEQEWAREQELEALRNQARELGLPMPDLGDGGKH